MRQRSVTGQLQMLQDRKCGSAASGRSFRYDVLKGLSTRPRAIPSRWLYDRRGSELFEAITSVPEYYSARIERSILVSATEKISALVGMGRAIIEFGSGASTKTLTLLSDLRPSAYVPIDISGGLLEETVVALSRLFPDLPIYPIEGDFTGIVGLPEAIDATPRLGFFPGSTIRNLAVPAAVDLLRGIGAALGIGSMLLIGIDLIKDRNMLLSAYDDDQGVTAAFNLNLLHRINRELGGSVPVGAFRHTVRWNDAETRVEMHLEAIRDVRFEVGGRPFLLEMGETIHTENSLKYSKSDASILLRAGGWTPIAEWTDKEDLFSLILARNDEMPCAP